MLERALIQPQQCSVDPLDNAQSWGIPIWATDKLQAWLDKIYASLKDTKDLKHSKHTDQHNSSRGIKVKHLKGPFIKFESFDRSTRPVFLELSVWPTLNFDGDPGSCPFDTKRVEKGKNVKPIPKEIKENKGVAEPVNKKENKEMTRRPRTTAARNRRTEQLVSGYCEICRINYRDLSKHVESDQHLNFVRNDDNFLSLDTLINAGASVEAFLKLNRTKDIEKDCSLYANGDRDLHDVVLPEEKVDKDSKALNDFGVEQIKMVQCNGARRNLNLKLSSPHNLRARAKHESGHLLRSKGSPWHEVDKNEKYYDKFEGFTIKKRSKGTIWIEEEDPEEEKYMEDNVLKESKIEDYQTSVHEGNDIFQDDSKNDSLSIGNHNGIENCELRIRVQEKERDVTLNSKSHTEAEDKRDKISAELVEHVESLPPGNDENVNGLTNSLNADLRKARNTSDRLDCEEEREKLLSEECDRNDSLVVCNGHREKVEEKSVAQRVLQVSEKDSQSERARCPRSSSRRGGRSFRGRHRLSVEERLIEDNRAYYKVEVLGNKLRSSALPGSNSQNSTIRDVNSESKKDAPSSEKPVVVRFKRVRKSELSLLSDEAESFMFGECCKRDESSEMSDGDQSSVLPRDTESEANDTISSDLLSSPMNSSSPAKHEIVEEDSQDSMSLGRARKRRRTQAEALIKDNADYYKFETPGSRLRYQGPPNGIKEAMSHENIAKLVESEDKQQIDAVEKMYPSKPSLEVERMQFSFEAIPKSEPWYQTYQRQDEGAEFWHYLSEGDTQKPFLLPYEIENFHETLPKHPNKGDVRRKGGRGRGVGCAGRSPRKSPRCHASTLAIMSTIIRKREQQISNLGTIEECQQASPRSQAATPRPDSKSEIDEELKEMAKNIDEMLTMKGALELDDSFEPDNVPIIEPSFSDSLIPKGAPPNLLELLEKCPEISNCLENSSCASSECGEVTTESPLKRRKKRKNRTGWPGIKMRKKLHTKQILDVECDRLNVGDKDVGQNEGLSRIQLRNGSVPSTPLNDSEKVVPLDTNDSLQSKDANSKEGKEDVVNTLENASAVCKVYQDTIVNRDKNIEASVNSDLETAIPNNACEETDRSFLLHKDQVLRQNLSEVEEVSENDPGNDENNQNVFRKDVGPITISERQFLSKSPIKKRQRINPSSETCESHTEIENQEILCIKDAEGGGIISRKHHNANGVSRKRQQQRAAGCENPELGLEHQHTVYKRRVPKRRIYSRKRQRKSEMSSDTVFEDENCKKDSFLSIACRKQQQNVKGVKRRSEAVSSEAQQDSEFECTLSERISPSITSEIDQRRSSIEFQPVVRMMKIDEKVDVDHSILSVTVASNRRLRSSSSPRSNAQPPKKRLKTGRGQFGRWLKNS